MKMNYNPGDKIQLPNGAMGEVKMVLKQEPPVGDLLIQYRDRDGELRCRIVDPVSLQPRRIDGYQR
jgi:hypothetical protein